MGGAGRRRVAVYDAHWSTAGGGERYAVGVAEALGRSHDVTLLAHEPVDVAGLGERLGADLSGVEVVVCEPTLPLEVATAGFDLLVNLSYRSHGRSGARRGIYVVHFPDRPGDDLAGWQRTLVASGAPLRTRVRRPRPVSGFHDPDTIRWQSVRWTDGHGVLEVPPGPAESLVLHLGRYLPSGRERAVQVLVDGRVASETVVRPARSRLDAVRPVRVRLDLPERDGPLQVELRSESEVAHDSLGNGDRRRLGVPLVGVSLGPVGLGSVAAAVSLLTADPPSTDWLATYDLVVANSAFTRRWISRWWAVPSLVLEPPVHLRQPGEKAPRILSVGRFFGPGRGHSKKQLEMVQAFRSLHERGRAPGWSLHLAGGCSPDDAPYLDEVRAAATGLPVEVHVDATGAELDRLYETASIYWHVTGLGEDVDADPVTAEHFGITTVEAMSAGAVPVVLGAGGQPDIVRDGVDGMVIADLDALVASTESLVADPVTRSQLSRRAVERAERFGSARFAHRLDALVEGMLDDLGDR